MDEDDILPDGEMGEDAPVVDANEPADDKPISVDELAAEMGHTPKDKWRGDPDKWKPAAEFLKATVDVNKGLSNRLKGVESQLEVMARTSAQITERTVAREREKLLAERVEAIEMADVESVNRIDSKLQTLPQTQIDPPETRAFKERNASWFEKDPDATAWAINRANTLAQQGITSFERQLAIVEREAKTMFPEHFEELTKPKPAPLNKPGNRGSAPQGTKNYASLPASAKAVADDYERRKICTKEEYAKTYFEELG